MRNRSIESALELLGAAGLGVGLMYILDPENGRQRREKIASTTEHALSSTGEMLGTTLHGATHSASAVAKKISGYAHHLTDHSGNGVHESKDDLVSQARRELVDRAGAIWPRRKDSESHPVATTTGITAATIGVLGLGAGLMYVLDP